MLQNTTADAMQLLRRVLALRKPQPAEPNAPPSQIAADSISAEQAVESMPPAGNEGLNGDATGLRPDAPGELQIQAGCTAIVAIFQVNTTKTLTWEVVISECRIIVICFSYTKYASFDIKLATQGPHKTRTACTRKSTREGQFGPQS